MGYEVTFHYLNRKEEGFGYDIENPQQYTKSLGQGAEDVPLDKLVGLIMSQYARRDIMVNDVEVFETVRRKITYKETAGGVIIKNKKYSFDQGVINIVGEVATEPVQQEHQQSSLPSQKIDIPVPTITRDEEDDLQPLPPTKKQQPPKRPIRSEVFNPEPDLIADLRKKGVALTVGTQYPIMQEKIIEQSVAGKMIPGTLYQVIGDHGKPVVINSMHFSAPTKGLYGYDYATHEVINEVQQPQKNTAKLLYMGDNNVEMPVLRR